VKRSQSRKKEGTRVVRGRIDAQPNPAQAAGESAAPAQAPRKRNTYPPEVNTPDSNIEFLECLKDLVSERIEEAKRDLAKRAPE
jgi:hypothetical protein